MTNVALKSILVKEDDDGMKEGSTGSEIDIDSIEEDKDVSMEPTDGRFCVECADQLAATKCTECDERFCEMCFSMLHRTGNRRMHHQELLGEAATTSSNVNLSEGLDLQKNATSKPFFTSIKSKNNIGTPGELSAASSVVSLSGTNTPLPESEAVDVLIDNGGIIQTGNVSFGDWIMERTRYIPIRLSQTERKQLRLYVLLNALRFDDLRMIRLEATLNVSEYTDKIDIMHYSNKSKRIVSQIREICAILSGLVVATFASNFLKCIKAL